jgi:hypothetical protein
MASQPCPGTRCSYFYDDDGGHVADLRRGAGHDRAAQQRIALAHRAVLGHGGVLRGRADQEAAVGPLFDAAREAGDVDQRGRPRQRLAHQVDQVGTAAEVAGIGHGGQAHGVGGVGRARKGEGCHGASPRCSPTAATMPL